MLLPDLEPFDHQRAITLTQAAQRIRSERHGRLNRDVAVRWASRGYRCRGWTGEPLVLPTVLLGSMRWLMPSWLAAWEAARVEMSRRVSESRKLPRGRPARSATADHRRAATELRAAGFPVKGAA